MEDIMSKVTNIAVKPIDERVAAVLASDEHRPSTLFSDLISEVDDAIDAADQTSREAREAAANPKIIDHGARGRAEDAEHLAHRLRNGLQALQQLHNEALARERAKAWHAEADTVEAKRDEIAAEFRKRYPAIASWLPDILTRMAAVDREVEHVNTTAPGQESRRLVSTELCARGTDQWGQSGPVGKQLRLPQFSGLEPLLWPLPVQFGVQLVAGLFPGNGTSVESVARGVQRFEMDGTTIRAIDVNGKVIDEVAVDQPTVPPLRETLSLREQRLQEQSETAIELARHADDSRARERERQRLNDARENAEFVKRQQAISR
jgi:hypothetical protein